MLRRFERSRRHFIADYLPLADEWVLWDNIEPPHCRIADGSTHSIEQLTAMLNSSSVQETPVMPMTDMVRIGLEAGQVATAKMLDYYKRMGIKVTPEMTLAPERKKRLRAAKAH